MALRAPVVPADHLVPYVISASGHRNIRPEDTERLRERVRAVFRGMRTRMPSSPLLLLNALAEGADQLIATVALEEGVSVVAVLPMPYDLYRAQLPLAAQQALDELRSYCIFEVQLPCSLHSSLDLHTQEGSRAECYEELAVFLASNSQALVALWDGKEAERIGGTSRVVRYVREGIPAAHLAECEEEPQSGIVYQVVTPREGDATDGNTFAVNLLATEIDENTGDRFSKSLAEFSGSRFEKFEQQIERFNFDANRARRVKNPCQLLPREDLRRLTPYLQRLHTLFARADAIAVRSAILRGRYFHGILSFALAGTIIYAIHNDIHSRAHGLWLVFPFFVSIALMIHKFARVKRVEERYLDDRALGEALRVQFFWELGGVRKSVADHYLVHHRTEMDWIRSALKSVWLFQFAHPQQAENTNVPAVLSHWLQHQQEWYGHTSKVQRSAVQRRERFSRTALWFVVIASVAVPVVSLNPFHSAWIAQWHPTKHPESWTGLIHFLLATPAMAAGAYRLWTEQAGFEEQVREYARIGRYFSWQAKKLAAHLNDPQKTREILETTGIEALEENGRWLLLHRERPLQVVGSP